MPSDAWADLNRRAAAVPGVPWQSGVEGFCIPNLRFHVVGRNGDVVSVVNKEALALRGLHVEGMVFPFACPDLSHAGTRGILRAALGSPSMRLQRITDGLFSCEILDDTDRYQLAYAEAPTRQQAEAAALVALAEARGQWGPG